MQEIKNTLKEQGFKKALENTTYKMYIKGIDAVYIYKNSKMIETVINNDCNYYSLFDIDKIINIIKTM